jgi:hypothetical protein
MFTLLLGLSAPLVSREFITARQRVISFNSSSRRALNAVPHWYHVYFSESPDIPTLRSHGITLSVSSCISPGLFSLFLTPIEAEFCSHYADLAEVTDKLMPSSTPLSEAASLILEVDPSFAPPDCGCIFHRLTPSLFDAVCDDLPAAAAHLSAVPEVYAVTPLSSPVLSNDLGAGYSQHNTKTLIDGAFPRVFQAAGLDGRGAIVTVMDSPLDSDSTFFADDAWPVENATLNLWHRKVVYDLIAAPEFGYSEHGTHVCGTIAGDSPEPAAARFNGVAPGAKLAHLPFGTSWIGSVDGILAETGSRIWSNSWNTPGALPVFDYLLSAVAHAIPDVVSVWSAGNGQVVDAAHPGGCHTLGAPAGSKNVVTVGALSQLPVLGAAETPIDCVLELASLDGGETFHVPATFVNGSQDPFRTSGRWNAIVRTNLENVLIAGDMTDVWQYALLDEPPPLVVASALFPLEWGPPFPIVYVDAAKFWNIAEDAAYEARLWPVYRPASSGDAAVAFFSAKGPSAAGIVKPDVVAPGVAVYSARSVPGGGFDHAGVEIMHGTSMAAPNVAGCLALIEQYLAEFTPRIVASPTAALLRAVLVNAAEPLHRAPLTPTNDHGFGQINLANTLPLPGDDAALLVADRVPLRAGGHAVTRVSARAGAPLRVAVAYADPPGGPDSLFPLVADLDLVVVAPSGMVSRGNQHAGGSEEHFTTAERVIIGNSESGEYEIHVFLTSGLAENVSFAVAVAGRVDGTLDFEQDAACLPCGAGTCGVGGNCVCPAGSVGRQCQVRVAVHSVATPQTLEITVEPLEVAYVMLTAPGAGPVEFEVEAANPLALRAYVGATAGASPVEYNMAFWNGTLAGREDGSLAILIRNDFAWPENYTIVASWVEGIASPTPKESGKGGLIAGVVVGVLAFLALVGVAGFCFYRTRKSEPSLLVPTT